MKSWIFKLLEEYTAARKRLMKDRSEENYKEMINACYWLVLNGELMEEENGILDILWVYEGTVLEFWKQYQTAESLCQVVYFYSDWQIARCMGGMAEIKEHMKKGLPYAKLYHEMEDRDYSACVYIDIYLGLYETCRTGEGAEQLDYAKKACSLAREYAMKYQTLQMLKEYHLATIAFVAYQRLYGQDEEAAAEKEREYEEFSAGIEEKLVSEAGKRQEEMFHKRHKIYLELEGLRCRVLPRCQEIVAEHRHEIFQCIKLCLELQQTAQYQGLEPLQRTGDKLAQSSTLYRQILAYGIQLICDALLDPMEVSEKVMEHFHTGEDRYENFILYLCVSFLNMMQQGYVGRIIKRVLSTMLPVEERVSLTKYLEFKLV